MSATNYKSTFTYRQNNARPWLHRSCSQSQLLMDYLVEFLGRHPTLSWLRIPLFPLWFANWLTVGMIRLVYQSVAGIRPAG
jgi:hypothetical protein